MQKKNPLVLLVSAVALMAVSGCGNDITIDGGATPTSTSTPAANTFQLDDFGNGSTGCSTWCNSSGYFNAAIGFGNSGVPTVGHSFPTTNLIGLPSGTTQYLRSTVAATQAYDGFYAPFLPYGWYPSASGVYDVTQSGTYDAITFYIKGNSAGTGHTYSGGDVAVSLILNTYETEASNGWALDSYSYDVTSSISATSTTWTQVIVPFSSLVANGGSASTPNLAHTTSIGFKLVVNGAVTGTINPSIDLSSVFLMHQ